MTTALDEQFPGQLDGGIEASQALQDEIDSIDLADCVEVMYDRPFTEVEARKQAICHELAKTLPLGKIVSDFEVTGWSGTCSPVDGVIWVTTSEGERLPADFTRSRERIDDRTIFADLNDMANQWREDRTVHMTTHHVDLDRRSEV